MKSRNGFDLPSTELTRLEHCGWIANTGTVNKGTRGCVGFVVEAQSKEANMCLVVDMDCLCGRASSTMDLGG